MTKPIVWVSRAMVDPSLIKGYDSDLSLAEPSIPGKTPKPKWLDTLRRVPKGVQSPEDRFPKELYGKYPDKHYPKLPDICMAGGFWVVSAAMADVMQRFEMGRTAFYPVKVFQHNQKTRVPGDYFCISFGEQKSAFLPDESPRARKPYPSQDLWKLPLGVQNQDDIAVDQSALAGPDLWIDPRVWNAFFVSDPLAKALKEAKLTRRIGLRRCRVI